MPDVQALRFFLAGCAVSLMAATPPAPSSLDPRGRMHIPIGIPNTVDSLKTFVEAEGNFSPGFGSYGIYFWVWDDQAKRLYAPTMDDVKCEHGLAPGGLLIPWSKWRAGDVEVKTEVCQVERDCPTGKVQVVAARVALANLAQGPQAGPWKGGLYVAVRPPGPAGGAVTSISVLGTQLIRAARSSSSHPSFWTGLHCLLSVNGHPALFGEPGPSIDAGVEDGDTVSEWALKGRVPRNALVMESDEASGLVQYRLEIAQRQATMLRFICPVLPGRRAAGHRWDGVSTWAQFDLNKPDTAEGGILQPDPGLDFCRSLSVDTLFTEATAYWSNLQQRVRIELPDPRWAEAFAAIIGHAAMCMNEGAPDVAVVNYNVFNRDGMYVANIFQKSGNFDLAEAAIDYFLRHPFNGRVQPEADNPGQILWVMGEHWKFTHNRAWLARVYPSAQKLAAMIRYYRTTPGPYWVWDTSLDFGDALPKAQRKELKPGACDGFNPNYTEAYDIAGLRAAVALAEAVRNDADATAWRELAAELLGTYEQKFGARLAQGYGSYAALWPCRLYPFGEGRASEQFKNTAAQKPADWRYFPLAKAHQGLLAGNRAAAFETLNLHLDQPQMRGWYAFDEGGPSGVGGWHHARTTWPIERNKDGSSKSSVAMPHGWAIAELHLLLRDALLFEDGDTLMLLAGVPPEWFRHPAGMKVEEMPTHFGSCSFDFQPQPGGATFALKAAAPGGGVLRLPTSLKVKAVADGKPLARTATGGIVIPPRATRVDLRYESPERSELNNRAIGSDISVGNRRVAEVTRRGARVLHERQQQSVP
jgi:hypothetical protein